MLNTELLNKEYFYVIGVSGGPDSMYLLNQMFVLGYKFLVAHVNYKKRLESDKEEELVKVYCQKFNLPFFSFQINPEEYQNIKNFQAWARNKRYKIFSELAFKNKSNYIVLAHHLDDHLETYLLQKKRKSFVKNWGLASEVIWNNENIWLIRPLLNLKKKQIQQYLSEKKVPYLIDNSNFLPIYQRNIIRQEISKFSAQEKSRLFKEIVSRNKKLYNTEMLLKKLIREAVREDFSLDLLILKSSPLELRLRLLYYWLNKNTNKGFVVKKKKILQEIEKQLFSSKIKLNIILNKNYQLKKSNFQAVIITKI